ncbi:maleylpyruvate isomerase family mycothiol-dependent enzyme [Antrihabitans stalactiti]|uniref:Maleylpyruvate isomerase family mycothiol-dependent enzyme n=1 Tax=Antrihabitans stalactiti TaxID=2584121 RepID=A0A848KKT1_9NOCA|nr:maleylpyruvate isomerase family mycothiol-dependent enzyme [Antrihabitans stalactiti]
MSDIAEIVDDLQEEWAATDRLLEKLNDQLWKTQTPSPGWKIKDQIAHLATSDAATLTACKFVRVATPAAAVGSAGRAIDPALLGDGTARLTGFAPRPVMLGLWRSTRKSLATALKNLPPDSRIPWFSGLVTPEWMAKARLMEAWAHTLDIADTIGVEVVGTDRLKYIAELAVHNQKASFDAHNQPLPDEEIRVELSLPSGKTWTGGHAHTSQRVLGSALDFALVATRRRHREDTALQAVGHEADRWLEIVQAYQGSPGAGREPLNEQ